MGMKQIANKIGNEGAKIISKALKSNSTLTILDLECDEERYKENRRDD